MIFFSSVSVKIASQNSFEGAEEIYVYLCRKQMTHGPILGIAVLIGAYVCSILVIVVSALGMERFLEGATIFVASRAKEMRFRI